MSSLPECYKCGEYVSHGLVVCSECMRPFQDELETLRTETARALAAFRNLMDYRKRNTLNFQLEKLDDYLRELGEALGEETR